MRLFCLLVVLVATMPAQAAVPMPVFEDDAYPMPEFTTTDAAPPSLVGVGTYARVDELLAMAPACGPNGCAVPLGAGACGPGGCMVPQAATNGLGAAGPLRRVWRGDGPVRRMLRGEGPLLRLFGRCLGCR